MTHDRTGDEIEPVDPNAAPPHDPRCDGTGWIDRDSIPAVPCTTCKPHLAPHRLRAQTYGPYDPPPEAA